MIYIARWFSPHGYWSMQSIDATSKEEAMEKANLAFPFAEECHITIEEYLNMFKRSFEK